MGLPKWRMGSEMVEIGEADRNDPSIYFALPRPAMASEGQVLRAMATVNAAANNDDGDMIVICIHNALALARRRCAIISLLCFIRFSSLHSLLL